MESLINQEKIFVLHPKPGNKTFEVTHRQFSGDWVDKTIQYELEVSLLNNVNQNGFVYVIDRKNLLIDGSAPDTVFDQLACDCGNALFPMKFLVNSLGEIEQIFEHQQMVERWEIIKNKLINYYEGDTALDYIKLSDSNIRNTGVLKKMMQNHLFVYFFFKPLYGFYQDNKTVTKWKPAPFMDFSFDIPMKQTLVKRKKENNDTDEISDDVFIEIQSDSDVIAINGVYTFNPKDNSLVSCEGTMLLEGKKEIKLTFMTKQEKLPAIAPEQKVMSIV
ncbi:hypothetical protein NAT51_07205 [Flavobacterium amniphilum]|uniref:hypothetical protein n=1 Tax=Flavobacterium amniphilum TaxID=1834035 RepID=UPI00202A2833|nr:hypothetical protein [Flavobacterium amniphilum]MCL9805302.1 hypothetical protein [Flavobacterium amniphilum]